MDDRPALSTRVRKYGRYDFSRFDHLSSGFASAGSKAIGIVHVDCQFLFRKSQWGVLGDQEFPAGMIYLNLNLGPPQGCTVKSAAVTVTLDSEDPCLRPYGVGRDLHPSNAPVQITDWFGPKQMVGSQTKAETKWKTKMAPEINVAGMGGGGVGAESEKSFSYASRWSFNGQLLRSKVGWWYTTLKWEVEENELQKRAFRSNHIHTAFAFEHSGQPFLMKVEIEGKLEKWTHRVKEKLKFGPGKNKEVDTTTTLIDFGEYRRFQQPLDKVARGLPRAMEMENLEEVPVEIPDPTVPTFQPIPFAEVEVEAKPQASAYPKRETGSQVPAAGAPGPTPVRQRTIEAADPTQPTVEDFRRVLSAFSSPAPEPTTSSMKESIESSQSADLTFVNSAGRVSSIVESEQSFGMGSLYDEPQEEQHSEPEETPQRHGRSERESAKKARVQPGTPTCKEAQICKQSQSLPPERELDPTASHKDVRVEDVRRTTTFTTECDTRPITETKEDVNLEAVMELVTLIPFLLVTLKLLVWLKELVVDILSILSMVLTRLKGEPLATETRTEETRRTLGHLTTGEMRGKSQIGIALESRSRQRRDSTQRASML